MILNLGCVVEGYGDVQAVPVLLRRLQQEMDPGVGLVIPRPIRTPRYKLVKAGELERVVQLAARQLEAPCAILILIDAEDDCPAVLGPDLLDRAREVRLDLPIAVVLAKFEFEAWFLAAIESLGGRRGLRQDLQLPGSSGPESIRDAKGFLRQCMEGRGTYSATIDQPALTAVFDMELARKRSDSFDKCWREVERLFGEVARRASQ